MQNPPITEPSPILHLRHRTVPCPSPLSYKISSKYYADYSYDSINRLNLRTFHIDDKTLYNNYIYYPSERNTDGSQVYRTNQLKYEIIDNTAYRYTYDDVGNITKIEKGSRTTANSSETAAGNYSVYREYSYDALGQLLTETSNGTTTTYTYDKLGNILTKSSDEVAVNYTYGEHSGTGWKYLLTGIQTTTNDENGNPTTITESIAYDKVGNPTNYRGASMSWFGRQMTSYSKGNISATFTYDADGLRGSKTVNGSKTTYFYVGDQLMYECRGDGKELYFYYDSYGNLSAIRYISSIGDYYYFVTTNKQGDVLGLYSENGNLKVSYEYDAWGNCTVKDAAGNAITSTVHIGNVNPIRYRGYYYDNDLGLYYLQSRYYDATIGRFINADGTLNGNGDILGFNMFAYCSNNPIVFSDPSGGGIVWAILGLITVGVCIIGLSGCSNSDKKSSQTSSKDSTSAGSDTSPPTTMTEKMQEDRENIAITIVGEAGGSSSYSDWKQGQEAVAWTIINRYESTEYPNDWTGVVAQEEQFRGYERMKNVPIDSISTLDWDYAYALAGHMVSGQYDNIACPKGFTKEHVNMRTDKGQMYDDWDGVIRTGGNVFFRYK